MNYTKINCKSLANLQTQSIHSSSGSVIYTDAPKDHDGNGKDFAPTDLLATALGTCVITIMNIEAKRRAWNIEEINVIIYKRMTSKGPRKIKSIVLEIFMPQDLDYERLKVLQNIALECPVKLNLEESIDIDLNWHQGEIDK